MTIQISTIVTVFGLLVVFQCPIISNAWLYPSSINRHVLFPHYFDSSPHPSFLTRPPPSVDFSRRRRRRRRLLSHNLPNPTINTTPINLVNHSFYSLSGVSYETVHSGLQHVYPPKDLSLRNSVSRSDGYWAFEKDGYHRPIQYTYGEFDLDFFASLLDIACLLLHSNNDNWDNKRVFVDLGSGSGRLVFAAAALHPQRWKGCRGIEVLPGLHQLAVDTYSTTSQTLNPHDWILAEETRKRNCTGVDESLEEQVQEKSEDAYMEWVDVSHLQQMLQNITLEEWDEILSDLNYSSEDNAHDTNPIISQEETSIMEREASMYEEEVTTQDDDDDTSLDVESRFLDTTTATIHALDDATSLFFWNTLDKLEKDMSLLDNTTVVDTILDKDDRYNCIACSSLEDVDSLTLEEWNTIMKEPLFDFNTSSTSMSQNSLFMDANSLYPRIDTWDPKDDNKMETSHFLPCPTYINTTSSSTQTNDSETSFTHLPLAPIQFSCASFEDPYEYLADLDIAFCFSSCLTPESMEKLAQALGRQCKPGSIIITTEFPLPLMGMIEPVVDDPTMPVGMFEIELVQVVEGNCWVVGGKSTAYIHRIVKSLGEEYGIEKRIRPILPLNEQAFRLVQAMEKGVLTNTTTFIRNVQNALVFYGFLDELESILEV